MRAGTASRDLNPALGVHLGGYPYVDRATTGIHDDLCANALFLQDDTGARALILATDLFWITRGQADDIRDALSRSTGIERGRIVITCSHTHSAPWMSVCFEGYPDKPFETVVDAGYVRHVAERCVAAGQAAVGASFEAEWGTGLDRCGAAEGIGGNRRDPVGGPVDTDVPVLAVRDAAGPLRAIWTTYALHPTILQADNALVSADYVGPLRDRVTQRWPDAVVLYSMGSAGDQSPRFFRTGTSFDEAERFGHALGDAVLRALEAARWRPDLALATSSGAVDLVPRTWEEPAAIADRVTQLRRRKAELVAAGAGAADVQTADRWVLGAECEYVNAVKERSGDVERRIEAGAPYEVSVLALGHEAWVFLPGEVFCDFGLAIKRDSPYPVTHVVTLANGDLPGYCITRDAADEGGYEVGNSLIDPASGDRLTARALELLRRVHNEERP